MDSAQDGNIQIVRREVESLKEKARRLESELERLKETGLYLEKLLTSSEAGLVFSMVRLVEDGGQQFKHNQILPSELTAAINELYLLAKVQAQEQMHRFPDIFEEACKINKLTFDWDSRYPKYKFFRGFFQLEIIEAKGIARLSDPEGRLGEVPADTKLIIELIKNEEKRLFQKPFDDKKFLEKLRRNYLAIIKKNNLQDGDSIPIRSITRRLGKNENGFKTDDFLVDISRLLSSGKTTIDGKKLAFQQTKNINSGMFVPDETGGNYVGFILFREA